jgi:hypothetical protein
MKNTIFSGVDGDNFNDGTPLYKGTYAMSQELNQGGFSPFTFAKASNVTLSDVIDFPSGIWIVIIEKMDNNVQYKVNKCQLEFSHTDSIGAKVGSPVENGFETGLRVVSKFSNSIWKTGIWSNGIFTNGKFETGIWYDGVFNGDWG